MTVKQIDPDIFTDLCFLLLWLWKSCFLYAVSLSVWMDWCVHLIAPELVKFLSYSVPKSLSVPGRCLMNLNIPNKEGVLYLGPKINDSDSILVIHGMVSMSYYTAYQSAWGFLRTLKTWIRIFWWCSNW